MYRKPSRRKTKQAIKKPNLIPILDAVFIFIFFLLMSASFLKIYEIQSDIPLVSESEPPSNKKPLSLTLEIDDREIKIFQGVPSRYVRSFRKSGDDYPYESLREYLINLKQRYKSEKTIILEPKTNITYESIVKIMDAVRTLRNTDPALYTKDKSGLDVRITELFSNIVFGNIGG